MSVQLYVKVFFILLLSNSAALAEVEASVDEWVKLKSKIIRKFPSVEHVRPSQLSKDDMSKYILIDVREPNEYAVSHIEGAINLLDSNKVEALAKSHPSKTLLLYCSVGYRSSLMAQELMDGGVVNVKNIEGSIFEWVNDGNDVVRGGKETQFVHPFNKSWGRYLESEYWVKGDD